MAEVGSPVRCETFPAMEAWVGLQASYEFPPFMQALSTIKQLVVIHRIKVPLLHEWAYLRGLGNTVIHGTCSLEDYCLLLSLGSSHSITHRERQSVGRRLPDQLHVYPPSPIFDM